MSNRANVSVRDLRGILAGVGRPALGWGEVSDNPHRCPLCGNRDHCPAEETVRRWAKLLALEKRDAHPPDQGRFLRVEFTVDREGVCTLTLGDAEGWSHDDLGSVFAEGFDPEEQAEDIADRIAEFLTEATEDLMAEGDDE